MSQGTLSCRELIAFLDAFLEGELSEREAHRFRAHLEACEACVAYLDGYRRTGDLLRRACQDDAPPPGSVPEELVAAILDARRGGR